MTAAEAAEAGIEHMNTIDYTTGPDAWLAGLKEVSTSYGTSFEKNKEKGLYNWKNIYIPQKVVASIEYEAVEVVHDAPLWLKNSTSQKPDAHGQIWKMAVRNMTCQASGDICAKAEASNKATPYVYVSVFQAFTGPDAGRGWLFDHTLNGWEQEDWEKVFATQTQIVNSIPKTLEAMPTWLPQTEAAMDAIATKLPEMLETIFPAATDTPVPTR